MSKEITSAQVEGAKKWYEFVAEDFQKRYSGIEGHYLSEFEDRLYDSMASFKGKTFLDLGTGGGRLALRIAPEVKEAFGVDISEKMIEIANASKGSLSHVHFETADATKLRFEDKYFDLIVSAGMFEYLHDPTPFLKEAARVLKSEEDFVFTCFIKIKFPLLDRILGYGLKRLFPYQFTSSASKYQANMGMRETLFQRAYHRFPELKKALLNTGFYNIECRSTFRRIPSHLFIWGSEHELKIVKSAAVHLNTFLGWFPLTKYTGGSIVVKARRRSNF